MGVPSGRNTNAYVQWASSDTAVIIAEQRGPNGENMCRCHRSQLLFYDIRRERG